MGRRSVAQVPSQVSPDNHSPIKILLEGEISHHPDDVNREEHKFQINVISNY
jgi:hypothetical protein